MSHNFSNTEKALRDLFSAHDRFVYKDKEYSVKVVGKPSPPKGECKTDIYILAEDIDHNPKEFKISIKQKNADFLENKMRLERAVEIFREEAQDIIINYIESIKSDFENEILVFFDKRGRTSAKSITLGWKFEILDKVSKNRSGILELSHQQKVEIYSGQKRPLDKKNSKVYGTPYTNSGIANYILVVDLSIDQNLDYYLDRLIPIEDFVRGKELYFSCKALNYRAEKNKWDGDRPLCVYVDWKIKEGKLTSNIIYNDPLRTKGNEVGKNVSKILKNLNIDKNNFSDLESLLDKNVNKYKK